MRHCLILIKGMLEEGTDNVKMYIRTLFFRLWVQGSSRDLGEFVFNFLNPKSSAGHRIKTRPLDLLTLPPTQKRKKMKRENKSESWEDVSVDKRLAEQARGPVFRGPCKSQVDVAAHLNSLSRQRLQLYKDRSPEWLAETAAPGFRGRICLTK